MIMYATKYGDLTAPAALLARKKRAQHVATLWYYRKGYIPNELLIVLQEIDLLISTQKTNASWQDQPRVPAGNPDGGQWVSEGGGSAGVLDVQIDDPPLKPVYPVELLIGGLSGLTASGVRSAISIVMGASRTINSTLKIRKAAESIEKYLGGKPDNKRITNEAGDIILVRGNKKIRFDIKNSGNDKPHFHIEIRPPKGGKWPHAGNEHRYYFQNKE